MIVASVLYYLFSLLMAFRISPSELTAPYSGSYFGELSDSFGLLGLLGLKDGEFRMSGDISSVAYFSSSSSKRSRPSTSTDSLSESSTNNVIVLVKIN